MPVVGQASVTDVQLANLVPTSKAERLTRLNASSCQPVAPLICLEHTHSITQPRCAVIYTIEIALPLVIFFQIAPYMYVIVSPFPNDEFWDGRVD